MVFFHERRCLWNNPNHVGTEHLTSALTALLANSKILVPKQTNEKNFTAWCHWNKYKNKAITAREKNLWKRLEKMRNHLEKQLSCAKVSCETQVKSTLDCTWEGSVFPYNCHTKRLQLLWVFPTKFCLPDPFFPRQTLTCNLGNFSF